MEEAAECVICCESDNMVPLECGHTSFCNSCLLHQLGMAEAGKVFSVSPFTCGVCRQWLVHTSIDTYVQPTKTLFQLLCKSFLAADAVPGLKEAQHTVWIH